MKLFVLLVIGLLVGSAMGFLLGYSHAKSTSTQEADAYISRRLEPDLAGGADYALTIIPMIERGDTNAAIQRLSRMIAVYYLNYASQPGTNELRLRARVIIHELARTNQVVANAVYGASGSPE
jgi:hypothetical protein